MRGNAGGATGAARGELERTDAFSTDGWNEIAFRRKAVLRRGIKGGAPDALPELGAQVGDTGTDVDASEGCARGTKKGRLAALREFGGSSEYREWIRGRARGDCVSMVVWSIYMALGWMGR